MRLCRQLALQRGRNFQQVACSGHGADNRWQEERATNSRRRKWKPDAWAPEIGDGFGKRASESAICVVPSDVISV